MELIKALKEVQITNEDCEYILMELDGFLCVKNRFMRFSIDDNHLEYLKNVLVNIFKMDNNARVVACAYKNELIDNGENTFIYADSIWMSTSIDKEKLTDIFNESIGEISPSDISTYIEICESIEGEMLFINNDGIIKAVRELFEEQEFENIKIIYWD